MCQHLTDDTDPSSFEGERKCRLYENAASDPRRPTIEFSLFKSTGPIKRAFYERLFNIFRPNFRLFDLKARPFETLSPNDEIFLEKKISRGDQEYEVKNVKNFGECEKACDSQKYLDCTGFSFCEATKNSPGQCIVTSSRSFEKTLTEAKDATCSAVSRSSLDFYEKTLSGKYMIKHSYNQVKGSLQTCAMTCTHDKRCKGFLTKLDQNGVVRCFFSAQLNPDFTQHQTDASYYSGNSPSVTRASHLIFLFSSSQN